MKISLDWLKDYVNTDLPAERIAEILTDTGLEIEKVEEVESVPGGLKGIVVGEVLEKWPHPNADRLNLTKVDIGEEEPLQIVCGAKNIEAGQKVVVSTIGATLYPLGGEPFKIKKGKIRGELSQGMICAEDEIGLGNSHDGIMVLEPSAVPGTQAAEYFELSSDTTMEIGLTPNRTDAMGHFGVARDLCVALHHMRGIQNDPNAVLKTPNNVAEIPEGDCPIEVQVENSDLCARYMGVSLKNIQVDNSPDWIQKRLKAIGLEPINNVVDITNYVMYEFGHPLHAFDQDKISRNTILVKNLANDTSFITLDDKERKLNTHDLMICDGDSKPLCIAGVFGGAESGVSNATTNVFLECAAFNTVSVRKSAKRHQLNTDASFRFERGVDEDSCKMVIERAVSLLVKHCNAEISGGYVDVFNGKSEKKEIDFSVSRCNKLIGLDIEEEIIESILLDLDFKISKSSGLWKLKAPKYRVDVTREADVVEEVLRIYGYNTIPLPSKLNASLSYFQGKNEEKLRNQTADSLSSKGFLEMMSNSLTKTGHSEVSSAESLGTPISLLNPLSQDLGELRTSLAYNMLEAAAFNFNRKAADLKLYEFGNVYAKEESSYKEEMVLGVLCSGKRFEESWNRSKDAVDITDVAGALEMVFKRLNLSLIKNQSSGRLEFMYKNEVVGVARSASAAELKHFGISVQVRLGFIYWSRLMKKLKGNEISYNSPSKFPSVRRDLSLLVEEHISFEDLKSIAFKNGNGLVKDVRLFDVYEGDKLPKGKKSYAINMVLSDANKTLNEKTIDKTMNKIIEQLKAKLSAELR